MKNKIDSIAYNFRAKRILIDTLRKNANNHGLTPSEVIRQLISEYNIKCQERNNEE